MTGVTEPLVQLENLKVRLGVSVVLASVNLVVEPGEVVAVVGRNGAGKTTLLHVVATLLRPSAGQGKVLGASLTSPEAYQIRPQLGLSGHTPALYPHLTLSENLKLVAGIAQIPFSLVSEALTAVGLAQASHLSAQKCSHGMLRRVDLARLLMQQPRLLLLDEAHAGLDQEAEVIVDRLLTEVRERHGGALLVSHHTQHLTGRVDRVVPIEAGVAG